MSLPQPARLVVAVRATAAGVLVPGASSPRHCLAVNFWELISCRLTAALSDGHHSPYCYRHSHLTTVAWRCGSPNLSSDWSLTTAFASLLCWSFAVSATEGGSVSVAWSGKLAGSWVEPRQSLEAKGTLLVALHMGVPGSSCSAHCSSARAGHQSYSPFVDSELDFRCSFSIQAGSCSRPYWYTLLVVFAAQCLLPSLRCLPCSLSHYRRPWSAHWDWVCLPHSLPQDFLCLCLEGRLAWPFLQPVVM